MGLADEIEASHTNLYRRHTAVCSTGQILAYLPDEDKQALERLFSDRRVFGTAIAELLNAWGPKMFVVAEKMKQGTEERHEAEHLAELCTNIKNQSVQRHRTGKCLCGREG